MFHLHTPESAPAEARSTMEAVEKKLGFVPSAVGLMAESPELLNAFTRSNALFERSTLTPVARETLVLTVAARNGCELCLAMHTPALSRLGGSPDSTDPGLVALRRFVHAVLDSAGGVADDDLDAFIAAGYTARNALEVVLGIGTYTLSTFANRLTRAPIDPQFAAS